MNGCSNPFLNGALTRDNMNEFINFINKNFKLAMAGKYIAILILMALPFVNVSCSGMQAATLSGYDLAIGTQLPDPQFGGIAVRKTKKVPPEWTASAALAAAVVGLAAAAALRGRKRVLGVAAASALGTAMLMNLNATLSRKVATEGRGILELDWALGYWLALLLFIAGTLVSVYLALRSVDARDPLQTE